MWITQRRQVTIPKRIRERFGLTPDTEVAFMERDGHLELVRRSGSERSRIHTLYGGRRWERSTDELMQLIRQ